MLHPFGNCKAKNRDPWPWNFYLIFYWPLPGNSTLLLVNSKKFAGNFRSSTPCFPVCFFFFWNRPLALAVVALIWCFKVSQCLHDSDWSIDEMQCLHISTNGKWCMRKNVLATYVQHKTASNRHKRQYIVKLFNFLNFKMMTSCCVASCTIVQLTTQQLVLISTLKDKKLPFYLQDTFKQNTYWC